MVPEQAQGLSPAQHWVQGLLEVHAAEAVSRSLVVRVDIDPSWAAPCDLTLENAMKHLLRLVLATVPDGCAVDLEGARSSARVASMRSGEWAIRWQVSGEAPPRLVGESVRLRPRPGDAAAQLGSTLAKRVHEAFAVTDWQFELCAVKGGQELLARATRLE